MGPEMDSDSKLIRASLHLNSSRATKPRKGGFLSLSGETSDEFPDCADFLRPAAAGPNSSRSGERLNLFAVCQPRQ